MSYVDCMSRAVHSYGNVPKAVVIHINMQLISKGAGFFDLEQTFQMAVASRNIEPPFRSLQTEAAIRASASGESDHTNRLIG